VEISLSQTAGKVTQAALSVSTCPTHDGTMLILLNTSKCREMRSMPNFIERPRYLAQTSLDTKTCKNKLF